MDALDVEQDIQLQRSAPALLADLGKSLGPFLTRSGHVRRNVRLADTDRLVNLLEPFQELPQLLDPHLKTFVPLLAGTFIECLQTPPKNPANTHLLIPLSKAICKLLYTFCKIRGDKVIVQFLSTETSHLELLLSALEKGSQDEAQTLSKAWGWEERYITLLWLSQLLLVPFDLASISTQGTEDIVELHVPSFVCPPNVPAVTLRVISLAIRYLSSPGKERDAAKILLVRVATRPDMQQVGVLSALVEWALSCLSPTSTLQSSPYHYIGILSFLAGMLLSSIGTPDMLQYLSPIFNVTRDQDEMPTTILDAIKQSAVSRKVVIKIFRAIALLELSNQHVTDLDRIQTLIGDLLDCLEDSATPVRLAASKALSIITLKLDSDMASQVVDVVLDTFQRTYRTENGTPNISDVKPFQWHGLVLTFSHLLYRRSIPPGSLAPVLNALRLALSFEKRTATSATSTGTNVRDAANFGIWALARRYSTAELEDIHLESIDDPTKVQPALQTLAIDLIISGSLDPAGNVRRGSSAALQELIGRNPEKIHEGIKVVQLIDYHAIALRSRAVEEVAIEAATLSDAYYHGLLQALMRWRGVKDTDATARCIAASAVGKLVWAKRLRTQDPWPEYREFLNHTLGRMKPLSIRDSDERHGLILCLAAVISPFTKETLHTPSSAQYDTVITVLEITGKVISYVSDNWSTIRNQHLMAEATSQLFLAMNGLLRLDNIDTNLPARLISGQLEAMDKFISIGGSSLDIISDAVADLLTLVEQSKMDMLTKQYIYNSKMFPKTRKGLRNGAYLQTIFKIFPIISLHQKSIISTIQEIWTEDRDIDTRVEILRCLGTSRIIHTDLDSIFNLIEEGLDDFTTNAQGDIGSKVRIEAAKVVRAIWEITDTPVTKLKIRSRLCGRILRTAADKLDKVRRDGHQSLLLDHNEIPSLQSLDSSSASYFSCLLDIQLLPWYTTSPHASSWSRTLLSGYVTSADTGASNIVSASRYALLSFCEASLSNTFLICQTLFLMIKSTVQCTNDRILVSVLEVVKFMFDMGIMQKSNIEWGSFYFWVQKAHYQSANIRKIETCVRIYGALTELDNSSGVREKAAKRLL
ncbi:beta-tubulin cofactor d, partial [Diplocarpon rosae]